LLLMAAPAAPGESGKDKRVQDKPGSDKGLDHEATEDKGFEDEDMEDQAMEDEGFKDEAIEDKGFKDEAMEDKGFKDKAVEDKLPEDREGEYRGSPRICTAPSRGHVTAGRGSTQGSRWGSRSSMPCAPPTWTKEAAMDRTRQPEDQLSTLKLFGPKLSRRREAQLEEGVRRRLCQQE
jgi:hypothetical protein